MINLCVEKICKECLKKVPEKEREAFLQNLEKLFQDHMKGCHGKFNCGNTK